MHGMRGKNEPNKVRLKLTDQTSICLPSFDAAAEAIINKNKIVISGARLKLSAG